MGFKSEIKNELSGINTKLDKYNSELTTHIESHKVLKQHVDNYTGFVKWVFPVLVTMGAIIIPILIAILKG